MRLNSQNVLPFDTIILAISFELPGQRELLHLFAVCCKNLRILLAN